MERERVYLPLQPSSKNVLEGAFFCSLSLALSSCPAEIFCFGQGRYFGGDSGEFWIEREFVLLIYSDNVSDAFACHVGLTLSDDMTRGQLKKVAKCARQPKIIFSSHCWVESCVIMDGKTGPTCTTRSVPICTRAGRTPPVHGSGRVLVCRQTRPAPH